MHRKQKDMGIENVDHAGVSSDLVIATFFFFQISKGVADGVAIGILYSFLALSGRFGSFIQLRSIRPRGTVKAGTGYFGDLRARLPDNAVVNAPKPITTGSDVYRICGHQEITLTFIGCHWAIPSLFFFENLH